MNRLSTQITKLEADEVLSRRCGFHNCHCRVNELLAAIADDSCLHTSDFWKRGTRCFICDAFPAVPACDPLALAEALAYSPKFYREAGLASPVCVVCGHAGCDPVECGCPCNGGPE